MWYVFVVKHQTAYEMRISDWSSDVCSSDLIDSRAVCILRETLARHDGLADFAFAMQGLGSGAISLAGSQAMRQRYLPNVAAGQAIAAFALTEPEAGSDVSAISCPSVQGGASFVLNCEKTMISNGRHAAFCLVFSPPMTSHGTAPLITTGL